MVPHSQNALSRGSESARHLGPTPRIRLKLGVMCLRAGPDLLLEPSREGHLPAQNQAISCRFRAIFAVGRFWGFLWSGVESRFIGKLRHRTTPKLEFSVNSLMGHTHTDTYSKGVKNLCSMSRCLISLRKTENAALRGKLLRKQNRKDI